MVHGLNISFVFHPNYKIQTDAILILGKINDYEFRLLFQKVTLLENFINIRITGWNKHKRHILIQKYNNSYRKETYILIYFGLGSCK